MFFLGIAGPLLPYLLMTGIIIAFTLEVSLEKLCRPGKELPDHHRTLYTPETMTLSEGQNYHFDQQQNQTSWPNAAEQVYPDHTCPEPPGTIWINACPDTSMPAEGYHSRYSGLSPPLRFV